MPVTWTDHDAVLLDLDGVITPTAEVHMRAWAEMFNAFLDSYDGAATDLSTYTDADYFAHVDGKPRYDGVRDFLTSRGIELSEERIRELGDRKNDAFNDVLARDGVVAYPGSVALLDHLRDLGVPLAVVSSSANAPAVLEAAGPGRPLRHRRQRRGRGRAGPAGQARARHLRARRPRARCGRRALGRLRGRRLRASAPARPVASRWSSASTAAPARRR